MIAAQKVPAVLADQLATGPGRWEQRVLGETHGLRRVLRCDYHGPAAPHPRQLVAKAYATAEGARTARLMVDVHHQLTKLDDATVAVPRLIFYDAPHRLLVQELATGRPYPDLAMSARLRPHLAAAGTALATIHGLRVPAGPRRALKDNLRELAHPHPEALAERVPEVADRVEALLAGLSARDRALGPAPATLTHRDLHLRQLLRDRERVWVLDWDLAAATDPALDLGNLVAYMATKLPAERARACTDALLDAYTAAGGPEPVARAPLYEAFTYIRLACKRFRLAEPDWRARVTDMLARAETALEA
jgi:aminoglycoside phosphotransferase (APT) family kinase protein